VLIEPILESLDMSLQRIKWLSTVLLIGIFAARGTVAQERSVTTVAVAYQQAEALVRAHQWDQGIAALQPILKQGGTDLKALNLAGLAYTGKGDLRQADRYFQRALQIQPTFLPVLKNLGINEFTLREISSAQKDLELALKESPGDPVVNLYLGQIAYGQGRFKVAADRLRRAPTFVSHEPNLSAAYGISLVNSGESQAGLAILSDLKPNEVSETNAFSVGLVLAQADQPNRAIPYFENLRERYPASYNIGFNLLACYVRAKKSADALAIGGNLIQSGHDTDEVENALAQAYEGSNDTPKAVAALRRAIELAPKNEENYLDFANLCIDHRDLDNGLRVVEVGLNELPTSSRLVFERGVLYAMQDRFELAEQDFERSARLAPLASFGYVGIGVTYLETGHAESAIAVLRERLKKQPDDASLLYLLGEALMRTGVTPGDKGYAEAQSAFERAVKLNPNLCLAHVDLGEIYIDQERFKDAIQQLEKARSIDPKEKSAYSHLAVAYRKAGDTDNAKRVLTDLKNIYQQEQGWLQGRIRADDASSLASPEKGPGN